LGRSKGRKTVRQELSSPNNCVFLKNPQKKLQGGAAVEKEKTRGGTPLDINWKNSNNKGKEGGRKTYYIRLVSWVRGKV